MSNKHCEQLQELAREHQEALDFAERIANLADDDSRDSLEEGVRLVHDYYYDELEEHLQHEEQTMFAALLEHSKEHLPLCMQLGKEHGLLRTLAPAMRLETAPRDLPEFAAILRRHTLFEDEHFLPLVESLFTPEQLERVMSFKPQGTLPRRPE